MKNLFFFIFLNLIFTISFAQNQGIEEVLTINGSLLKEEIQAGTSAEGELVVILKKGWHINSNKPIQEFLIPTAINFSPISGIKIDEITYPTAKKIKFPFATVEMMVYDGTVQIKFKITPEKTLKVSKGELSGTLTYQACDTKTCLSPAKKEFKISFSVKSDKKKKLK